MSTQHNTNKPLIDDMEKSVVKFLRDNPDFFERHRELLASMILPHEHQGAVSLVERQVQILREQKESHKRRLNNLIANAQANEKLNAQINQLILALLDAKDLDDVLDIVQTRLSKDFNADTVVVRLFNTGHPSLAARPDVIDWSEPVLGAFEKIIKERRPACGQLKHGQLESLFSDEAGQIASAALIPLVESENSKTCYGMLAIGSHQRDRFSADMGTLFLSQIGNILARVLKRTLDIDRQSTTQSKE
ncbi:MAG: DUF484 family protein [Thioalkalispiraceae bacterium]|jgi:uncharacterized protein YigA (DUF484 family)